MISHDKEHIIIRASRMEAMLPVYVSAEEVVPSLHLLPVQHVASYVASSG